MPDGANLVALRQVFGVSTDSLLLGEETTSDAQADGGDARVKQNRRVGLMYAYMSQAMGLFISLLGLLALRLQLVAASGFLMQIFSLLGFQLGYKWFQAGVDCGKWRLCYLRGCLWMMAIYPCQLLLGTIWSLSPGPHSGWLKTASILLAYLAVCLPGDRLLRKKGETKG